MPLILIIDDDPAVQSLFAQFLKEEGYSVLLASNGLEGLDQIQKQTPNLVITDIMMPEMDGLELIRTIRARHPDLPIIAISGGMRAVPVNFLPQAEKFGAVRVFEKPVSLTELLKAVQKLLGETTGPQ